MSLANKQIDFWLVWGADNYDNCKNQRETHQIEALH